MSKTQPVGPVPDVRQMFELAERYREASKLLEDQAKGGQWGCHGPQTLVDSFALELYLKCLFVLDTGEPPPRGHNLLELFGKLNEPTRVLVREAFDRIVDDDQVLRNLHLFNPDAVKTTDFARSLDAASNTFDKRRYLYEPPPSGEWYWAHILGGAIRSVTKMDLRLAGLGGD